AEKLLDPLKRAADRMQAALYPASSGKRDVERLGGELRMQRCLTQGISPRLQFGLHRRLGGIDGGTGFTARVRLEFSERFQAFGERPGLAQVARLRLFELRAVGGSGKIGCGLSYQLI